MRNKSRRNIRNKNSIMARKKRTPGKKVVNATKVSYDEIQFQSTLERTMYLKLKTLFEYGKTFFYESSSATLIEAFEYTNEIWANKKSNKNFIVLRKKTQPMTYKPDFSSHSDLTKCTWIVECKGRSTPLWPVVFKLFKKWLSINNPTCKIYCPSNDAQCEITINKLKEL
jgi:hypothetical protein